MLPSRLKALESDDSLSDRGDSRDSTALTKEALEQRALSEYKEALQLEKIGEWEESEALLRNLLDSELLSQIEDAKESLTGRTSSLAHLKYCVTTNLGHSLLKQNKIPAAIQFYIKASELDNSDVNLWYQLGKTAMQLPDLRLAIEAFEQGLKCSSKHWGCIDGIITTCYSVGEDLLCLCYVSSALSLDSAYLRGHTFKAAVLERQPMLAKDFKLFHPDYDLGENVNVPADFSQAVLDEARNLTNRYWERCKPKFPGVMPLESKQPMAQFSWLALAITLIEMYNTAYDESPQQPIYRKAVIHLPQENESSLLEPSSLMSSSNVSEEETGAVSQDKPQEDSDHQTEKGYERWISSQKRRSARVRSTVRREEPSLTRSLTHLIPQHLLPRDEKKEAMSDDSVMLDLCRIFGSKDMDGKSTLKNFVHPDERIRILQEDGYFQSYKEKQDVLNLIHKVSEDEKNNNIVEYISTFVRHLATLWKILWPENLTKAYIKIFKIYMNYYTPYNFSNQQSLEHDLSIILYGELLLDDWINHGKKKGKANPLGKSGDIWGGDFPSLYLGKIERRSQICDDSEILGRIFWLESMLLYHLGDHESTTLPLEYLFNETWFHNVEVVLPNVRTHYIISEEIVESTLKSLRRNKSLSEVRALHSNGQYEEVEDILCESLSAEISGPAPSSSSDSRNESGEETTLCRQMQFAILLDTYWRQSKFKETLRWGELNLHEALSIYRTAHDEEEKTETAEIIAALLTVFMDLVSAVGNILFGSLPQEKLTRLVQSLTSVICIQMEVPDISEMPIESVAPWILLHHIIKHDEECRTKRGEPIVTEEEPLPPSLLILLQGHEYLGRRGWCCFSEGALLFHILDVIYPIITSVHQESQIYTTLTSHIDQIFYCLYGQLKKTKGRYTVEHSAYSLALTWTRARQVFSFTKPRELPAYDSTGKCCISNDTESLLLKLIAVIPPACDPAQLVSEMTRYIEGEREDIPKISTPLPEDITDIYYFLGHYYFRNKYWYKVLKYVLLDVCANPGRVDSWACLALARATLIETKINSCDSIKNESEVFKNAAMVSRCYERSLRLDPLQSTLWIERGSFSYMLQSFCSNLLKKEQNLSLEMFKMLENKKDDLIKVATDCFSTANKIWYNYNGQDMQDERWLHQYILGKIAEKKEDDPQVYINHYLEGAQLLHNMGAKYPRVICHAIPQYLAVESLEMYYRIHVSILKYLEKNEGKPMSVTVLNTIKNAINKMAESPFVLRGNQLSRTNSQDETEAKVKEEPMPTGKSEMDLETNPAVDEVKETLEALLNNVCTESNSPSKLERTSSTESSDPTTTASERTSDQTMSRDSEKLKATKADDSSSSDSSSSSSSSSSSDDSSSPSSDSSESSSTDSTEEEGDSKKEAEVKQEPEIIEREINWKEEYEWIVTNCLKALELCTKRFQEHFKSFYRLGLFYFRNDKYKNLDRVRQLLLEQGGLFFDRRPYNFFNGVWRIPNQEIDRPGSFAAHMGRCVHLLLDFLMETKDFNMLFDLAFQLRIVPEPDKKFLRDSEREELYREALSLSAQALRRKVQDEPLPNKLKSLLMETYHIYKKVSKSSVKEPLFSSVLAEIHLKLTGNKYDNGNAQTEAAIKYCKAEKAAEERATAERAMPASVSIPGSSVTVSPVSLNVPSVVSSSLQPPQTTAVSLSLPVLPSASTVAAPSIPASSPLTMATLPSSVSLTPIVQSTATISKRPDPDELDIITVRGSSIPSSIARSNMPSAAIAAAPFVRKRGSSTGRRGRGRPPLSRQRQPLVSQFSQAAASLVQQSLSLLQQNPVWASQLLSLAPGAATTNFPGTGKSVIPPNIPSTGNTSSFPPVQSTPGGLSITPVTLKPSSGSSSGGMKHSPTAGSSSGALKHSPAAGSSVSMKHSPAAGPSASMKHSPAAGPSVSMKHAPAAGSSVSMKHSPAAGSSVSVKHSPISGTKGLPPSGGMPKMHSKTSLPTSLPPSLSITNITTPTTTASTPTSPSLGPFSLPAGVSITPTPILRLPNPSSKVPPQPLPQPLRPSVPSNSSQTIRPPPSPSLSNISRLHGSQSQSLPPVKSQRHASPPGFTSGQQSVSLQHKILSAKRGITMSAVRPTGPVSRPSHNISSSNPQMISPTSDKPQQRPAAPTKRLASFRSSDILNQLSITPMPLSKQPAEPYNKVWSQPSPKIPRLEPPLALRNFASGITITPAGATRTQPPQRADISLIPTKMQSVTPSPGSISSSSRPSPVMHATRPASPSVSAFNPSQPHSSSTPARQQQSQNKPAPDNNVKVILLDD